jgi:ATP/maltotriose-dependent transcriptional regulator MalT
MLARIYCSEGFYDLARNCLRESKTHYCMNPIPDDISIEEMELAINTAEASGRQAPKRHPRLQKEHANQSLSESLTVRELEVLALVASGLSNQDICDKLFLALCTVKGYNQTIFGKLQVKRRTEAVVKARALGLV